ncbi:alpha/beta hydrolase [Thermoleophilia bacterium SCSIO 60948]|nr:alpha/beta hydrolase [Thermoleophilia bacterium SCSIO 60948]
MAHALPRVEGVENVFLRIGERGFHVAAAGAGTPVVLLHGWPQHWWCWREVMPRLAAGGRRALAPDLRGFGWSDVAWSGLDRRMMAADVAALMDELDVPRATIVGQGWGGWVAATLASAAPERVDRLVLLGAPAPGARLGPTDLARLSAAAGHVPVLSTRFGMRRVERRFWTMRILRRMAAGEDQVDKDVQRRYARDANAVTRARASMLLHRGFLTHDLFPLLCTRFAPGASSRVTSLLGELDRFCSARLAGAGDADLSIVPGAGHLLAEERPEAVVRSVL